MTRRLAILLIAVAWGCESPSAPVPSSSQAPSTGGPTPPAPSLPLLPSQSRVSGNVTDESGMPLGGVRITVEAGLQTGRTLTTGAGTYDLTVDRSNIPFWGDPSVAGVLYASALGYGAATFPIGINERDVVKPIRLRRERKLAAGQSIGIAIETDSSSCFDSDSVLDFSRLCEELLVTAGAAGRLTVSVSGANGIERPVIIAYYGGQLFYPGVASFPVVAGGGYWLRFGINRFSAPQGYIVTTAIDSN